MPKIATFFNQAEQTYTPEKEWNFGEVVAHADKGSRADEIYKLISDNPEIFTLHEPEIDPIPYITRIHCNNYIDALKMCSESLQNKWFYPSVFRANPEFNATHVRSQKHLGFYAYDTFTPVGSHTFKEAARSVQSAVSAMNFLCQDPQHQFAYALCRPSGHHACSDMFGGYCFFNNAACAAALARDYVSRVAILDLDYHHGNGTQNIFYERDDVLVINVHADPSTTFPYFAGYEDETGAGKGANYNLNIIAPKGSGTQTYLEIMNDKVIPALTTFAPEVLIISLGLDTAHTDPLGDFCLDHLSYKLIAELIKGLDLKTLVVQEGGYDTQHIGEYVHAFLGALGRVDISS